jgi:hypothetical protein
MNPISVALPPPRSKSLQQRPCASDQGRVQVRTVAPVASSHLEHCTRVARHVPLELGPSDREHAVPASAARRPQRYIAQSVQVHRTALSDHQPVARSPLVLAHRQQAALA